MTSQENPPRNNENEVERFDTNPVSSETKVHSYKIMDQKEKEFFIANEKAKIQELRGQLVEKFEDTRPNQEKQEAPADVHPPKKQESGFRKKMAKWMMTFGLMTAASTASAKTSDAEKNFSDSTTTSKEVKHKESSISKTPKNTVPLYTQSKTPEGGITPTGLSNSFYENEFGVTESDIGTLASQYGFSTSSPLEFQSDLIDYMVKHHPDAIDGVMEKYGETKKGQGIQGLKDGNLGVRTAWLMGLLKNGTAELTIDGKKVTYSTATPDSLEGGPTSSGGEIFSTDGFDKLVIFFDNSGSMIQSRAELGNDLGDNTSNVPVQVFGFNETINETMKFNTPTDASEYLKNIPIIDQHDKVERTVDALIEGLESMDTQGGKIKVVACTDEALQKVSQEKLEKLQKISAEKGIDLHFSIKINGKRYNLTLEDVEHSFDNLIKGFNRQIDVRKNIISEAQTNLENASGKKKKDLQKEIDQNQKELEYFQDFVNGISTVNLTDSDFEKTSSESSLASK
jgi:hypothetical protein